MTEAPVPRSQDEIQAIAAADLNVRFGARLLDIRPASSASRLAGVAWLPVESSLAHALPSHMLGSHSQPLMILAASSDLARGAAQHLRERGWPADYLDGSIDALDLRAGTMDVQLWRPDPFLVQMEPHLPPPGAGPVVDLGAGNGRDACYLATRGYDCLLIDRYDDALELARDRALRLGVTIRTRVQDLRQPEPIPGAPYALALTVRFLERPVLQSANALLQPGGLLVLHTFASSPDAGENGRVRPRYRLDPAELPGLFPEDGWELVHGPELVANYDRWIRVAVRRRG